MHRAHLLRTVSRMDKKSLEYVGQVRYDHSTEWVDVAFAATLHGAAHPAALVYADPGHHTVGVRVIRRAAAAQAD